MTQATTLTREPIKVVADIIQKELGLPDGQVMLGYEKWTIPTNDGLYIVLNYLGGQAIGNNNYFTGPDQLEHQEVAMRHIIQIDLMSFSGEARARKEEVLMALRSIYSQQQQELFNMSFSRIPTAFIDAASAEETKILNRFTTSMTATALHTKVKPAPYYDKFNDAEVHENE